MWACIYTQSGDNEHTALYQGEYAGRIVHMVAHAIRRENGTFGKQKRNYGIDGDRRVFNTEEDMMEAIDAGCTPCDNCILRGRRKPC